MSLGLTRCRSSTEIATASSSSAKAGIFISKVSLRLLPQPSGANMHAGEDEVSKCCELGEELVEGGRRSCRVVAWRVAQIVVPSVVLIATFHFCMNPAHQVYFSQ